MRSVIKRIFSNKASGILLLISLGLLIYTTLRAVHVSMTHDESSTFFNYLHRNVWASFFSPEYWGTANLHITNTLLMQVTVGLFGTKEIFVRMPNLIAHVIYLFFSARLVMRVNSNIWIALAGFIILNTNPYFLDFFSLGRGYGLAAAFSMMSFYYLYQYLHERSFAALIGCFMGAFLAVISNFTYLNFYAALLAFVGLGTLVFLFGAQPLLPVFKDAPFGKEVRFRPLILAGTVTLLLAGLLYVPITTLSKGGEFEYGVGSFWETAFSLARYSLKGQAYFGGKDTIPIFTVLSLLITASATFWGLSKGRKVPSSPTQLFYFAVSLIGLTLVLSTVTQYYLLGTKYLAYRTATIFIPITGLIVFSGMHALALHRKKIGVGFAIALGLFSANHLFRSADLAKSSEWYYDVYTRDMVEYVSAQVAPGDTVSLGLFWTFHPSARFYRDTRKLEMIAPFHYHKPLMTDNRYDYYYVNPNQGKELHEDYEIEKKFGWVGVLYKRKDTLP